MAEACGQAAWEDSSEARREYISTMLAHPETKYLVVV